MTLKEEVAAALRRVYDPEIPVNIYDLGLVYDIEAGDSGKVSIRMTLTSPNCPVAGSLPGEVERAAKAVRGVGDVAIELTFDPPWSMDRMSAAAKLALGIEDPISIKKPRR